MSERDIRLIIRKPVVTEKSNKMRESENRYVFSVEPTANKRQIKLAVEKLFEVKVVDVRTAIYRGKRSVTMNRNSLRDAFARRPRARSSPFMSALSNWIGTRFAISP